MLEGIKRRIIEGRINVLGKTLKHAGWSDGDIQKAMDDARAAGNVHTLKRQVDDALYGQRERDMRHFKTVPQRVNEEGETVYELNGQFIKAVVKTAWEGASAKAGLLDRSDVADTDADDTAPSQPFRR